MANKITVTSAGTVVNANVTPDTAIYYSNKSRDWAISDRIVDNTDYSSKYYANESKKQADISTAKAAEVIESGNTAVSNIESARDDAITDITNQEDVSVDNVNTAGATQINLAKEQVTLATNQANIATEQATIATNKANEVVENGNEALSNIDMAKNSAISTITTQETTSKNNVIATGNAQVDRVIATGNNYDNLTHKNITNCILEAPNGVAEWSGVTLTGSLTNNQGVVSGFSESNYLTINKTPPAKTMEITSFELYGTATLNELNTHSFIFAQLNANKLTPQMGIAANNNFVCDISPDGTNWVTLVFAPSELTPEIGQTYNWLSMWDIESKILTFKVKKAQDETFTLSKTATLNAINWTDLMAIGMDQLSTGEYFRGTIDLSQSYIKINGKMWWQGNDLGFNQFRVKQGLRTLISNGRNEDKTLRNIENNVSQDLTYTFEDNATGSCWAAVGTSATSLFKTSWEYNNDENYIIGTLENVNVGQKAPFTMIGEMEVKNGNIVSFTPYNPVSLATKDEIDGMWIGASQTVFSEVSFAAQETKAYDLFSMLPKNKNVYEVLFMGVAETTEATGDTAYMRLSNSIIKSPVAVCGGRTPAASVLRVTGSLIFPVPADRILKVTNSSSSDNAKLWLYIYGYRKAR